MASNQQTRISVCMATFNGEKYILDQLLSIIKQLEPLDEIIISDDSSTDGTIDIIKSIGDSRIKLIEDQKFHSAIFNFENALKHASNDLIFLSDQDDLWVENKVKVMKEALANYDMVVCDCSIIDENNNVLEKSYFNLVNSAPGIIRNLRKNTYFGCCMAFKIEVLRKALPFPKDIPMHDIWLGFISDIYFSAVFLAEPLTFYRKHSSNASIASAVVSNLSLITKLKFRINILKYFPTLLFR
jgi:glycosyltransferase involved in cell wall biosynthesis